MTAKEFIIKREVEQGFLLSNIIEEVDEIGEYLIEFAKYHVEQALKSASEKATTKVDDFGGSFRGDVVVDKKSILNAYPLTLIKYKN